MLLLDGDLTARGRVARGAGGPPGAAGPMDVDTRIMIKPSGIITFTSDFSTADSYVGAVKGKILSIFPRARIIDISHEIPSGDIVAAAWCLLTSTKYYPRGSVHLAVVDPGVGSERRAVILEAGSGQVYVGPDNGIFSLVGGGEPPAGLWEINPPKVAEGSPVSKTFHGRDIFAPAAALVAKGTSIKKFVKELDPDDALKLNFNLVHSVLEDRIIAKIIHVDKFGNIVTSIPAKYNVLIARGEINRMPVKKPAECYTDIKGGEVNFIEGSAGFMEISANNMSAAEMTDARRGDEVIAFLKRRRR